MEVVRHQHVRVQRALKTLRVLRQAVEEEQVIVVSEEARLTIVPALHDMRGSPITHHPSPGLGAREHRQLVSARGVASVLEHFIVNLSNNAQQVET